MGTAGPVLAAGLLVGGVVGFLVGRFWAEHFRAEHDAARIRASQRTYRGGTMAFVAGAVLLFGLFVIFGHTVT